MASNHTEKYGLCQWEATDQVLRTEFNEDNAKIDATLKGLADKDLVLESALAGQAAAIAKLGNCSIQYFTYVGNGVANTPRSIIFPQLPLLFFIRGEKAIGMGSSLHEGLTATMRGSGTYGSTILLPLTWSGNTASFTSWSDTLDLNKSGATYHVFIFCVEDQT